MKEIRFFLASSYELEPDRARIGNLLRQLNDETYEKQGIHLTLVKWEDLDSFYNPSGKQTQYDSQIQKCELFIGLFWHIAGRHTKHEVEIARNNPSTKEIFIFHKTAEFKPDHEGSEDEKRFLKQHPNEKLNESQDELKAYLIQQNCISYENFNVLCEILTKKLADYCSSITVSEEEQQQNYSTNTLLINLISSPEAEPDFARLGDLVRYLDENNKYICRIKLIHVLNGSDMFVSLCHTSAPDPIPQQIQTAINHNQKTDAPIRLYFCWKHVSDNAKEKSLKILESQISEKLKHYPDRYHQSAEMKLHFLLQLEQLKRSADKTMLTVQDGIIYQQSGKTKSPLMACEDMPSLQNDSVYMKLKEEQEKILNEIKKLKQQDETSSTSLVNEIYQQNKKLSDIQQQINDRHIGYFRAARTLEEMVGKELDANIIKSRELINCGMIDEALQLLPDSQTLCRQWQEWQHRERTENLRFYNTTLLTLDCLYAGNARKNLDDIIKISILAIEIAQKIDLEYYTEALWDHALLLKTFVKCDEAVDTILNLLDIYEKNNDFEMIFQCYIAIGQIYLTKGAHALVKDSDDDYADALLLALKNFQKAEKAAEKIEGKTPELYLSIAEVQSKKGDVNEALENLDKALTYLHLAPRDEVIQHLTARCLMQKGMLYLKKDTLNISDAITNLKKAVEIFQNTTDAGSQLTCFMALAVACEYEGKNADLAKNYCEKAVQIATALLKNDSQRLWDIALLWTRFNGKISCRAAIDLFEQILKNPPSTISPATLYHNIAVAHFSIGNYVEAHSSFMKELNLLDLQNNDAIALCFYHIGNTWFERKKYAVARNYYIKAAIEKTANLDELSSTRLCFTEANTLLRLFTIQTGVAFRQAIAAYGKPWVKPFARFYGAFSTPQMFSQKLQVLCKDENTPDKNSAGQ